MESLHTYIACQVNMDEIVYRDLNDRKQSTPCIRGHRFPPHPLPSLQPQYPLWATPDENGRYAYARYITQRKTLPRMSGTAGYGLNEKFTPPTP